MGPVRETARRTVEITEKASLPEKLVRERGCALTIDLDGHHFVRSAMGVRA
ncbi:hypothetical protein GCM10010178_92090 [Lentzea flava]|uniref:Uncharacterized protein n=1 Tax=Lentzea flava TaxID=103732 RepID=A0ABQ2VJR1_9PSEU|nr:hypothetical protein GCM10010178_92090 [Lentzea flava]